MKKIGIISELDYDNVNYGNRLQAYALNAYLNRLENVEAYSLILKEKENKKSTKNHILGYVKRIVKKTMNIFPPKKIEVYFKKRNDYCNRFTNKYTKVLYLNNYKDISNNNFNYMIVGSDVVWAQYRNAVNKNKFLDFKEKSNTIRISYAASFGINWIPKENAKYILSQLKKFKTVTVREQSSIDLLESIGYKGAKNVCDPTLLINNEDWRKIEEEVEILKKERFIFTYLLGKDEIQRKFIEDYAHDNGLKIVNIPNADMTLSDIDNNFGDYSLKDCSPEEWLWLIDNAQYVFTDSFHGCIFSVIFKKKFIIIPRQYSTNINIRMIDFLKKINEENKFIKNINRVNINTLKWNYNKIYKILIPFIEDSKKILKNSIEDTEEYHE